MNPEPSPWRFRNSAVQHGACLIALLIVAGCDRTGQDRSGRDVEPEQAASQSDSVATQVDRIAMASQALANQDMDGAERLLRQQLLEDPQDVRALELSADIAAQRRQPEQSIQLYRSAIEHSKSPSFSLLDKLAQQWMVSGCPFETLAVLQQADSAYPNNPQIKYDIAGLAAMLALPEEATPPLIWLAQHGQGEEESWVLLADPSRVEPDESMCEMALQRCPQDLRPHYSLARLDALEMKWNEVAERLAPVVERHPDYVPAYALYGRALIEQGETEKVQQWRQNVPPGAQDSAAYWQAAGLWAREQNQYDQAARAFWEAARRDDSGQVETLTNLMASLRQIGREEEAARVAQRISHFAALRDALATYLERRSRSQQAALVVAKSMIPLGRIWEAEGWARLAVSLPDDRVTTIRQDYLAIREKLTTDTPWHLSEATIGGQIDLADLPVVSWASVAKSQSDGSPQSSGAFRFADQAMDRGLQHTCEVAPEATEQGHWIYQSVGGGTGVIDYDLDGWPDITLAMLDGQPMKSDSKSNRIFRNVAGVFQDVSISTGYQDFGFAQGITIGDFNDDGFADIFDANIGRNRLFRNNGDGTFSDVSANSGLLGEAWTTAAVIVDIDGDGFADLYEAAYCGGTRPYTKACQSDDGKFSTCTPLSFEAEPDRVWRGRGDGTFEDTSSQWLDQQTPGRGLGLIAGNLDERPGMDLFIANDMTVNHLWSAQRSGDDFQMTELGAIRGLAFNGRSYSQASMGMASGDADGDGDIDFFLTHFSSDHNTYYEQVSPGLWVDRSYQVGLAQPSMTLLGFGTEFADFDNNGSLELIVSNGHVDDLEKEDIAYHMPPQLFQREADGRWSEYERSKIGEYFRNDHLGRALATLDANRDGAIDFVITHLYEPVSLLINETEPRFEAIGLVFQAVQSHRDAIGTTITMNVGSRRVTSQLTAGDGYMCTNQRRLSIGLGTAKQASDIEITWPSGKRQSIDSLDGGSDYLLVEGSDDPYPLLQHHSAAAQN